MWFQALLSLFGLDEHALLPKHRTARWSEAAGGVTVYFRSHRQLPSERPSGWPRLLLGSPLASAPVQFVGRSYGNRSNVGRRPCARPFCF